MRHILLTAFILLFYVFNIQTSSDFIFPDDPILTNLKSRAGFDQSTVKNKCLEYSDDGECLGEEDINSDRTMLRSQCPLGYKKDIKQKCRKT
ncbi:hypothetical protein ACKWTF_006130 [Chironomus riparius]